MIKIMRFLAPFCSYFLLYCSSSSLALAIESPADFLARIYDTYSHDGSETVFLGRTDEGRIASKKFISVLEEDAALTPPGDIGFLGYDPLCQCQDYQELIVTEIRILFNDGKASHAAVTFHPFKDEKYTITTRVNLVVENGRWFIDDILDAGQNSIREAIAASNLEQRSNRSNN